MMKLKARAADFKYKIFMFIPGDETPHPQGSRARRGFLGARYLALPSQPTGYFRSTYGVLTNISLIIEKRLALVSMLN